MIRKADPQVPADALGRPKDLPTSLSIFYPCRDWRKGELSYTMKPVIQFVAYQFLELCVRSDFTQHAIVTETQSCKSIGSQDK
jgi:hypothetical protein